MSLEVSDQKGGSIRVEFDFVIAAVAAATVGYNEYRERREGPRWRPASLALLQAMETTDNQRFGLLRSCLNALEGLGFLPNQLRRVLG